MYDKQSPFAVTSGPRRRDSLSEAAHATLQAAIIDCQLPPGSIVSEAELSTRFAYGLATVRAAIMRLSAAGWIAPDGRRGSTILPVSAAHLGDLIASRVCLEPALLQHAPPSGLSDELRLRATIYRTSTRQAQAPNQQALLHQERALMLLVAQVIAAPRMRGWLIDTWALCLRADRHMDQVFGISRDPLPLAGLAIALADGDGPPALQILEQMRHAFDLRVARALSRSATALGTAQTPGQPLHRGTASAAAVRSGKSTRTRSAKGDSA
ncbi:GntR family transcriptional regulator [Paracoccus onubensis]|uniref:GntR family transcriptional regulator n=1 Tax=Paracoccus onubensis TaxID=1675788 RepID=A0A418SVQ4_9RHOB|nr:GntR family transcriptional regulator [Paracoccus onubensis]RJE84958.1 GntR family transcriptional regulator [Paracoccus onubensis]